MEKYQENPQLLDPVLQKIVAPLATALRSCSSEDGLPKSSRSKSHYISQFIWVAASVRWVFHSTVSVHMKLHIPKKQRYMYTFVHINNDAPQFAEVTRPSSSSSRMLPLTLIQQ